jgi:ubiquinone/menaquinone biosynthesis C-methylase UbiE
MREPPSWCDSRPSRTRPEAARMPHSDAVFSSSVPEVYDRYLGPFLFVPYAEDIAARVAERRVSRVLETAAGTGIVTAALLRALGDDATIVATDLNQGMVAHGAAHVAAPKLSWLHADAMALPFADESFDVVVCQFGVMFMPDQNAAFREARRVLAPGGRFIFNVWGDIDDNVLSRICSDTAEAAFPDDPPRFIRRIPFGHHDCPAIERRLRDAGFSEVSVATVDKRSAPSARSAATGLIQGTPLRNEIEARDPARLAEITEAAAHAIAAECGDGSLDGPAEAGMRAYAFTARR